MSPSRETPAGRIYLDLQKQARNDRRPVQELLLLYVLEAFLDRLSQSDRQRQLVLKGGVLLAAFGERRPTRDIDFQGQDLDNHVDSVREAIITIAQITVDDGVEFGTSSEAVTAAVIRDDGAYTGVRVSMHAKLATAKVNFHVDVNVGDPISPGPQHIDLPRLLGGSIDIMGYPMEMVHAEKVVTALSRGTVNSRWRDFMDVFVLANRHPTDGTALTNAVRTVAAHRQVELRPLRDVLDGYGDIGQARWAAWRRKQDVQDRTPESFADLVDAHHVRRPCPGWRSRRPHLGPLYRPVGRLSSALWADGGRHSHGAKSTPGVSPTHQPWRGRPAEALACRTNPRAPQPPEPPARSSDAKRLCTHPRGVAHADTTTRAARRSLAGRCHRRPGSSTARRITDGYSHRVGTRDFNR